ncbi:hypothetical protein [Paraflavitalea speifideaquila]|uniref:hypothetical protein n=1 Tax=Paraflavitalea speifideaquila TaxID=3076558 RepID=UPI0028EF9896|nr:hypothetical protein [Paraflavitalea speifideiaquila]
MATLIPQADSSLAQARPIDSVAKDTVQTLASLPTTPAGSGAILKTKPVTKNPGDSKWQFGIRADGGYSGVTEDGLFGFLEKESPMVADLASPNYSNSLINVAPQFPRPVNKASSLSKGLSFSVGGFVQRKLTNRLSLSVGLQYTYLSARQVVGTKINNNRTVNRAPSTSQLVSTYYDANNTQEYTNKYHFIELPVTLHAQLNKGKRLPITWDIGFSASRLVSTNALHYDGLGVFITKTILSLIKHNGQHLPDSTSSCLHNLNIHCPWGLLCGTISAHCYRNNILPASIYGPLVYVPPYC